MQSSWPRTIAVVVVLGALLPIQFTSALQVEFYSKKNYVGYAGGIQKAPGHDTDCYTLGQQLQIKSMKTDKCLMLYVNPQCKRTKAEADLYSFRVNNDTSDLTLTSDFLQAIYFNWTDYRKTQSFHVCSQERGGGPALDVDYYQSYSYEDKVLGKWRDVCTCQNVPENIRGGKSMYISIDNHGNDMEVFSGENCKGETAFIPAGDNVAAWLVPLTLGNLFDVASFRPIGLKNCIKLEATIVKFQFQNGTSKPPIPKKVKLATSGQIINDGAAETQEQYQLTESVTETVQFSIAKGYTTMNTVDVSASVTVSSEDGVPLVSDVDVSATISAEYKYQRGSSGQNTTTNTVAKTTTIQVTQTITVPGCHNCTATSYVNQAKNFPIKYESYSQITGYAGSTRMSAVQIKADLPDGVTYVQDVDEFTVEAVTEGTMYAEFGLETLMDIHCDKIPNCSPNVVYKGPTTFHYKFLLEATKQRGGKATTTQGSNEIGTSMGNNWNSLTESSCVF